jgi:hypothetical protein
MALGPTVSQLGYRPNGRARVSISFSAGRHPCICTGEYLQLSMISIDCAANTIDAIPVEMGTACLSRSEDRHV